MPGYAKASNDMRDMAESVARNHHSELVDAGVTIGVLACVHGERDDESRPALKLHGYTCAATIQITPVKQRMLGHPDAVIVIDEKTWEGLTEARRRALIDHELTHLVVQFDDDGQPKLDDAGRPKLRMRLHDWELGGFEEVAERHGGSALEVVEFRRVLEARRQLLLPWGDDMAGPGPGDAVIQVNSRNRHSVDNP